MSRPWSYTHLRCYSSLGRPRRYCEACRYDYVRQLERDVLIQGRAKFQDTMMVLSMKKSKSDLEMKSTESVESASGTPMMRERSQIFLTNVPNHLRQAELLAVANKEEVKLPTSSVPKKGQISITSTKDPLGFEKEKEQPTRPKKHRPAPSSHKKMLIKRKDIMAQMQAGSRQLEEDQRRSQLKEDMQKELGQYTMADLQRNISELTEPTAVKHINALLAWNEDDPSTERFSESKATPASYTTPAGPSVKARVRLPPATQAAKKSKGVGLPSINLINPF